MSENLEELGRVKVSLKEQEFSWRKRMWAIPKLDKNSAWQDKKKNYHIHVAVNEADGILRLLKPEKLIKVDQCVKCSGKISMDARNQWDLNKRKTITSLFGTDTTYVMLLLVMAIVAVAGIGLAFYMFGQVNLLQKEDDIKDNTIASLQAQLNTIRPKLILGLMLFV